VNDHQPYRTVIRHSIIALSPRATYNLRFDQIGDVFPPGMIGNDIHPKGARGLVRVCQGRELHRSEGRQGEGLRLHQAQLGGLRGPALGRSHQLAQERLNTLTG
jgi:hypothetical protein